MGNPRLPDQIHVLRGTFKPNRHGNLADKVQLEPGIGDPPEELDEKGREEWLRLVDLFDGQGVFTAADRAALKAYCQLDSEWRANPAGFGATRMAQWRALMSELGLTPGSRCKLTRAKPKVADGFAPKPARSGVRQAG